MRTNKILIYVNVFYVFENVTNDRYKISYVFWDTDMSFGLRWIDDFSYDVEWTKDYIVNRQEYDDMKMLYPELDKMLEERWIELRKTILNESNILQVLKKHEEKIINSGALMRDRELWGLYTSTEDTIENLHSFIEYRLQFLDKYYIGM